MKDLPLFKDLPAIGGLPSKVKTFIRDKAIERARTRIIVAGSDPKTFSEEDLEIVVKEEEDKLKGWIREKGILVVLAMFGVHFLG